MVIQTIVILVPFDTNDNSLVDRYAPGSHLFDTELERRGERLRSVTRRRLSGTPSRAKNAWLSPFGLLGSYGVFARGRHEMPK